jgi:hypothetical protein
MPMFNTGNQQWDQGLNSLSGSLFPDPSRVAMAGYYGAEMRNAQIQGLNTTDQMAARHRVLQAADPSNQPGPLQYQQNPNNLPPTIQDTPPTNNPPLPNVAQPGPGVPGNVPTLGQTMAPGAPPQAPPPQSPTAPPPQAPGPPGPPQAPPGPPGTPGPPGPPQAPPGPPAALPGAPGPPTAPGAGPPASPLSAILQASGNQVIGVGPQGGAIIKPAMSPQQAADATPALMDAHPTMTQGPAPPMSTPAPGSGAPPAPNNVGSNGSVPAGDAVSGTFLQGSITPAGGGLKTTGPAMPNGAPARPAMTLSQMVAGAAAAGMDAGQAKLLGQAYIDALYQKGMIDQNTYHHMMGTMDPSIINADTAAQTNITTTGMQQAGETQRTGLTQAGETQRTGMAPVFVASPSDPTQGSYVPTSQLQRPGGMPAYNPTAVPSAVAPVTTQPGGPGGPTFSQPTFQAQRGGTPLAQPGVTDIKQTQGGAYSTYMDPKNPTAPPVTTTAADAQAKGLVAYGAGMPPALTPVAANQQAVANRNMDQSIYQQPQAGSWQSPGQVTAPVTFSPAAQAQIQQREAVFYRQTNNPQTAHQMAVQSLIKEGQLPTPQQVNATRAGLVSTMGGRTTDPRLVTAPTYEGNATAPHLWIGLKGEKNPNDPNAPTAFGGPTGPQPGPQGPQVPPAPTAPPIAAVPQGPWVSGGLPGHGGRPQAPPAPPAPPVPIAPRPGVIPGTEARAAPPSLAATVAPGQTQQQAAPGPQRIGRAPPGGAPGQPAWVGGQRGVIGPDGFVYAAG